MKLMKKIKAVAAMTAVLAMTTAGHALTMIEINLGQIVEFTEKAFVGETKSVTVVETPQGWADQITFKVTDPIIGVSLGETVTWLQARSSQATRYPGFPVYEPGKEYAVFLAAKAEGSQLQAASGLGQGSFTVHRDTSNGRAYVRNQFNNSGLFKDMDVVALSEAMVSSDPATRSLSGASRTAKVQERQSSLTNRRSGASDLSAIKAAAQYLKSSGATRTTFAKPGAGSEVLVLHGNRQ